MSQQKKYFGTDGIRSEVGVGMIRPEQVLKLGWATGKVLKNHGESTVLIGKDTRISGYMFESALEAGFISAGINVLLVGPMPTPAVAYLTQTFGADVGIVISASHNPHCDNGIKFFSAKGQKISDEVEFEIEAAFEEDLITVPSNALGRAKRIEDAAGRYIEFCKSTYHARQKLSGLKVVLDCAHGATYHVAPAVFKELGAEVVSIGVEPNGININQHCGATDLAQLSNKVLEVKADLGIAFDGDGDRVMMVDVDGEIVDGDEILYILATQADYLVEGVVGTVMSNLGLEKALLQHNIELVRVNVGDRYVMQALKEKGWILGAEASGHVLSLDQSTTGDGIVSALQVMAALMNSGQSLTELRAGMYKYPQILENIRVDNPKVVANSMVVESAVQASEQRMAGQGRVLVRASGTEPLIRIMVEGETLEVVEREVAWLADLVRTEFC
ncbi:MAG: phosphoglucosamine mutase [Piscirickettsiaceae bacterium CG_4_9_14_3_um_filter_43_564]|nr:phosphoglucosamine mutase [Thiomicrospira sp.]OIP94645.1 MAG: phosphoglucosamine mutase [Thiomicrospira sp. CG2_30_44_34]PIQ03524.1 MAG: phosphoglucosamine mutase [Piscirickettsiaceae bacterium CG18_big_fil_WC_8_21_14_2_50_44_103]PIU38044.1 MAG: phosphoglucosamine mutase [Piscirickettsiaceae bacterium CG07_land_8_20_14_0_80_44_28]PIW56617.1 MAG: phosphoglucosamine mutase [Piscirickettsiaceae bacterium CG12_big_fil_rev_8_21_14_0_65_44_934]PIW77228.1 MAG: phosphoglucosamine mutase [Pisciricke